MTFRVGQKVQCVQSFENWSAYFNLPSPQVGSIYTVLAVTMGRTKSGLVLAEVHSISKLGWVAYRFRPLVETKTDISIFTKMLKSEEINA